MWFKGESFIMGSMLLLSLITKDMIYQESYFVNPTFADGMNVFGVGTNNTITGESMGSSAL